MDLSLAHTYTAMYVIPPAIRLGAGASGRAWYSDSRQAARCPALRANAAIVDGRALRNRLDCGMLGDLSTLPTATSHLGMSTVPS